jgi:hypothetical protein
MEHPDKASAYGQRSMRSTVTMLKYLARTSSESEINSVLQVNARCEGTLAERRQRIGKLRNEQEQMQAQLQDRVQQLASSLQMDANAKAAERARAAEAARRSKKMAQQAARMMGAVATHRESAQAAALSVLAPLDWSPPSPPRSPMKPTERPERPQSPNSGAGAGQRAAALALRPGRYCLRSYATDSESLEDDTFLLWAGGELQLSSAERAGSHMWLVRQPAGSHACTFGCPSGGALFGTPQGQVSVGEPPKPELAHFLVLPLRHDHSDSAAAGAGAGSGGDGGDGGGGGGGMGMGMGTGSGGRTISPRPFSSQSPRMTSHLQPMLTQRPQTASPLAASAAGSSGGAGAGGSGGGLPSAEAATPLIVRLYHPPSKRFLHIDPASGLASLLAEPAAPPAGGSPAAAGRTTIRSTQRPTAAQLSFAFELVGRPSREVARAPPAGHSASAMPPMRTLPPADAAAAVGAVRAPSSSAVVPSVGGAGAHHGAAGGAAHSRLPNRGAAPSHASDRRATPSTLPTRVFDITTGAATRSTWPSAARPEASLFDTLYEEGLLSLSDAVDLNAQLLGGGAGGGAGGGFGAGDAGGPRGECSGGGECSLWGAQHSATPTPAPVLTVLRTGAGAADSSRLQSRAPSQARGAVPGSSRAPRNPADDAASSAWEASQLDLRDVLSHGPLMLRSLFAIPASHAPSRPFYPSNPPPHAPQRPSGQPQPPPRPSLGLAPPSVGVPGTAPRAAHHGAASRGSSASSVHPRESRFAQPEGPHLGAHLGRVVPRPPR